MQSQGHKAFKHLLLWS